MVRRDRAWANFVVGTGLSFMPDQYLSLTASQRNAAIDEANRKE